MVGDYISRDEMVEQTKARSVLGAPKYNTGLETAIEVATSIPAADVVEVVRCRNCKYRAEDDFCTGRGWPEQLVADDGFCEKGKRKDGGQDE